MRPAPVVLSILREAMPGVSVVSVVPDVDYRTYPMVVIRRAGGTRNPNLPRRHSLPVLAVEAVSAVGPIDAEELYETVLDALYDAVRAQNTSVEGLGLQSISEVQGPTQAPSSAPDTWTVRGSVRVAVRDRSN